jgi:hypothetical protein
LTPNFKAVDKDRLFYDCYHYCLGFHLDEASCLRDLSHENIDLWVDRRRSWRELSQQRWNTLPSSVGAEITRRWREITSETVTNLHAVAETLLLSGLDYKLVVSLDQAYVYCNDVGLFNKLDSLKFLRHKTWTQAQVTHPKNTVVLKRSKQKFRSYLRAVKLTAQQRENLENFLGNHSQVLRIAPALQRWVDQPFNRTQDYFFIDHDSETWVSMLSLVVPGIIRKTLPIIVGK